VPTKPADGGSHSNLFTAGVDASLRSSPGSYRLQVVLVDAWDKELGAVGDCVLHEQIIRIEKPLAKMQYIILGVLAGLAILVLGALLGCQIRAHKDQAKLFVESFFKHEGQLAFKICWDAWVRPSPHTAPRV
jgi:hypothetical protein